VTYDPFPCFPVAGGQVGLGVDALAGDLTRSRPAVVALDGPAALPWERVVGPLVEALAAAGASSRSVRPLSPDTVALAVRGRHHDAVGMFAPPATARDGGRWRLAVPAGGYTDLWTGACVPAGAGGELQLPAPDGVAVLVAD
jgi:hypothetical protein